jgi:hypothetical protein
MLKPHPPKDVTDRVKERTHQAEDHLAGKSGFGRAWSALHLRVGNMVDETKSITGNEYVMAAYGLLVGLARGAVIGLLVGGGAYIFPGAVELFFGSTALAEFGAPVIAWATTTLIGGVMGTVEFFRDARNDNVSHHAAKAGDKIAKKGDAISRDVSPEVTEALDRMHGHESKPEPPHPEPPENWRFRDAVRQSQHLTEQEAAR